MWIAPSHVTAALVAVILALLAVGVLVVALSIQAAWSEQKRTLGNLSRVRCPFCSKHHPRRLPVCTHCYQDLLINCNVCGQLRKVNAACDHC